MISFPLPIINFITHYCLSLSLSLSLHRLCHTLPKAFFHYHSTSCINPHQSHFKHFTNFLYRVLLHLRRAFQSLKFHLSTLKCNFSFIFFLFLSLVCIPFSFSFFFYTFTINLLLSSFLLSFFLLLVNCSKN